MSRITRATVVALLVAAASTAILGIPTTDAHALGPGRVCFFNAPNAALTAGHIGWAFIEPGKNDWFYGATNDNNSDTHVAKGKFNGAYMRQSSSFSGVTSWFKHDGVGYTQYRCKNTPTSSVGAAAQAGRDAKNWGYDVIGNNCLDHAYRILTTYRGDAAPTPGINVTMVLPNDYFFGLDIYGYEGIKGL